MPVTPITPAQTDALAKLAEIPAVGSEEIAAALFESDNPSNDHLTWAEWLAYVDKHGASTTLWKEINDCRRRAGVVLTLMSEARKQGQRDCLGASSTTTGLSPIGHAPTGHEPAAVDPSRGALLTIAAIIQHWLDWDASQRNSEGLRLGPDNHIVIPPTWPSRNQFEHWIKALKDAAEVPAFAAAIPSDKNLIDEAAALLGVARGIIKLGGNQRERRENAIKIADWLTAYRSAAASCDEPPNGEDAIAAEGQSPASAVGLQAETPEATPSPPLPNPPKGQEETPCPMTVGMALKNCAEAVAFFDQVRGASPAEQIAVGADHWNWLEQACRQAAALSTIRASEEDR